MHVPHRAEEPDASKNLGKTRRRLSVVSTNKLVEGISGLSVDDENVSRFFVSSRLSSSLGLVLSCRRVV